MIDEELIAIAKAATIGEWLCEANLAFFMAFQPLKVISLLEGKQAVERERDELKAANERLACLGRAMERERDDLADDLATVQAKRNSAEAHARAAEEALKALRTQADNAAWNAHRSGITIDNAQLVRIFEGMVEQADAALIAKKGSDQ